VHCRSGCPGECGFERRVIVLDSEHVFDCVDEIGLVAPGGVLAQLFAEEGLRTDETSSKSVRFRQAVADPTLAKAWSSHVRRADSGAAPTWRATTRSPSISSNVGTP
jgi:hypothetical protein